METSLKCQNVTHFGLDWVARQDEDVEWIYILPSASHLLWLMIQSEED